MFKEERQTSQFKWEDLGNIALGRPNLGPMTSVTVYRLFEFTMRDVLIRKLGVEKANEILFESGFLAGSEFCRNVLNTGLPFDAFIADLEQKLAALNVGVLRVEKADLEKMELVLTVAEDLDCSGLPFTDETVCDYDEGFIAGILQAYTGKSFDVKEIDCWASGERICRFQAIARD